MAATETSETLGPVEMVALAFRQPTFDGRVLGELEESFVAMLSPGDTFVFGGEVLEFHAVAEDSAYCTRSNARACTRPSPASAPRCACPARTATSSRCATSPAWCGCRSATGG